MNNIRTIYPERSPVPIPTGPIPETPAKKLLRPQTPYPDIDHKSCVLETHKEHHMPQMSVDKTTIPPAETHTQASTENVIGAAPTSLKKMGSTHQFDATVAAFQPALQTHHYTQQKFPRIRPSKWNVQCRWTFERVGDCRYGLNCHWGHEGDEYLDEPGVKHTFKANMSNREANEHNKILCGKIRQDHQYYQNDRDYTHYDQVVLYDPGEYSAYSTSGYPAKTNCDFGDHQYVNGPMPNFSWVGDATNVDGWLGSQDHHVYEYVDSQPQISASLYGGAPVYDPESVYGNAHMEDQSENQAEASTGPTKKKKKCSKKAKKATAKLTEGNMEKLGADGIAAERQFQSVVADFEIEGGQIEKQLQDLHVNDTNFESTKVLAMDVEIAR